MILIHIREISFRVWKNECIRILNAKFWFYVCNTLGYLILLLFCAKILLPEKFLQVSSKGLEWIKSRGNIYNGFNLSGWFCCFFLWLWSVLLNDNESTKLYPSELQEEITDPTLLPPCPLGCSLFRRLGTLKNDLNW